MQDTYLIQRLKKPLYQPDTLLSHLAEAFSFGGGFRNGGLSKEAMALLRPIFSFDYMGSAEFEFGAVSEALGRIAKNVKDYVESTVTINPHTELQLSSWDEHRYARPKTPPVIHVFCRKEDVKEVHRRIRLLVSREGLQLKERSGLPDALFEVKDEKWGWNRDVIGGLELDNGWFYFMDKAAFDKMVALFQS